MSELASVLLPYQQRWVADPSPVKVCEKSRRIGLTWAEAADDTLAAASASGEDTLYIGYDKALAIEFVETCAMWARAFQLAAGEIEDAGDVLEDADREKGITAYRVRFASGHKIVALSSRPQTLRGKQGRVVIDEGAFHEDLDAVLKAALALIIWGGKVRIISTHDGEDNEFNQLVTDVRAGRVPYTLHRITFEEAMAEGLYRRICQKQKIQWSGEGEAAFREMIYGMYRHNADEELGVIPRSGGGVYIPGSLVEARMRDGIPMVRWEQTNEFAELPKAVRETETLAWGMEHLEPLLRLLNPNLRSYFGEDFGRTGDLTVLWPGQMMQNLVRYTPFIVELRNIPFEQQAQIVFFICDRLPRFYAAKFDARGNGQYLSEVAMQRYGSGRVEQVMLSPKWYRENFPRYKAALEDAMVILPKDDDVLADHRLVKVVNGVPGIPDKARTKGTDGKQRHGDTAIAGVLSYAASCADTPTYDYEPAPLGNRHDDRRGGDDDGGSIGFAPGGF
ncbi:MAG TPA: hypothetical protein VGB92_25945 [Longimicrobium sp.]